MNLIRQLSNVSNASFLLKSTSSMQNKICFFSSTQSQLAHKEKFDSMVGTHFLTLKEYNENQLEEFLWTALDMKKIIKEAGNSGELTKLLRGKSLAVIFQKRSTRTRFSFEAGAHHLGAHPIFCNKDDIHLGVGENVKDTAIVMSHLSDAITARVYGHSLLEELAQHSKVPIINALSDSHHPTQALADLMTIYEHFGYLKGLKIAWIGDGNNVLSSLLIAAAQMKMHIASSTPVGFEPCKETLEYARGLAKKNNTEVFTTTKPEEAVKNADIIVTDTWISMGQEEEKEKRLLAFKGYQITLDMLKEAKKDWVFLHCLPRKKEEVNDEVFYHKQSLVFQEAENRKWTIMSVMANLLRGYSPRAIKTKPNF